MSVDRRMLDIAEAIADGEKLDWTAQAENPRLAQLKRLGQLADAFRSVTATEPDAPGPVLFSWRHLHVLEEIGAGNFGQVYRAYDPTLRREVALKLSHQRLDQNVPSGVSAAEARLMARLRHPHILAVHGADIENGRVGIWSDLLSGVTLADRLAAGPPMNTAQVLALALPLAGALGLIHRRGLTHGDLKPANIMLEPGGAPVIMDFGAAREGSLAIAQAGSPLVMAPEQFQGVALQPAADIYALGAVYYRLLVGRYPIEAANIEALAQAHEQGATPEWATLPRSWRGLLSAMLAREPTQRPSARSVWLALEQMRTAGQRRFRRIAIAAVIGSLAIGLVLAGWAYSNASQQRDRAESTTEALVDLLRSPRPSRSGRDLRVVDLLQDYRPRLRAMLAHEPQSQARVMMELASTYLYFDDFDAALELSRSAVSVCTQCSVQTRAELAADGHHLATQIALIRRDFERAEEQARSALAIAEREQWSGWRYRYALGMLGDVMLSQRQLDSARQFLEPALADVETEHWPDPSLLASIRGSWLTYLKEAVDLGSAEVYGRDLVAWADREFGVRHSSSLSAHQGLNLVLIQAGKLEEAGARLQRDIAVASDWLGSADTTTIGLRQQRASLLRQMGEVAASVAAYEAIREDLLGTAEPDQEALLVTLGNLATGYKELADYERAEQLYKQVIAQVENRSGTTHARALLNRANLAELYLSAGRPEQAATAATQVVAQSEQSLGSSHVISSFATMVLGRAELQLGRPARAISLLRQAADQLTATRGEDAVLTLRAHFYLARALANAGRAEQALALLRPLRERTHAVLGAEHAHSLEVDELVLGLASVDAN